MRLSGKTVIEKQFSTDKSLPADFVLPEIEAAIRDKGYDVIIEKAYLCPCKGKGDPSHLNVCKNCGGSGWVFANPTKTKLIISGLAADGKLKEAALREWGLIDGGTVKVTGVDSDKLTYMDRITVLDATAEHNEIVYPQLTDDDTTLFAFTHYDVVSVDLVALFEGVGVKLKRLTEPTDYSFTDNIITFAASYNAVTNPSVTIRYRHRPVFHIIDVLRESMTSTKGQHGAQQKLVMPVHALAKRAHLVKDVENYVGNRLLDNSWLPLPCAPSELTAFQRQLRYSDAQTIFNNLTAAQIAALDELIHGS